MSKEMIDKIPTGEVNSFNSAKIMTSPYLNYKRKVQIKTHKRSRINKKWAKRYGFREEECFYVINPEIFKPIDLKLKFDFNETKKDKEMEYKVRMFF